MAGGGGGARWGLVERTGRKRAKKTAQRVRPGGFTSYIEPMKLIAESADEYLAAISAMLIDIHAQNMLILATARTLMPDEEDGGIPSSAFLSDLQKLQESERIKAAERFNAYVLEVRINRIQQSEE